MVNGSPSLSSSRYIKGHNRNDSGNNIATYGRASGSLGFHGDICKTIIRRHIITDNIAASSNIDYDLHGSKLVSLKSNSHGG